MKGPVMKRFDFDLSGRCALVTGAGQGVGREITSRFAAHGACVIINDFHAGRAEAVAQAIRAEGGKAVALAGDVSDSAAMREGLERVTRDTGPVDILINNAGNGGPDGTMPRKAFWETEPADWDRYLTVNLHGVMVCSHACVGGMVERGFGRIVTIISEAGRVGERRYEAYSAAKAGAAGFSRALAQSVGKFGVTVNTISLANMRRPGSTPDDAERELIARMMTRYLVPRQGEGEDVAAVALLLASNEASWITGQNYPVNGGFALAI